MNGFVVDPGVLDGIASTLSNASSDVDSLGNSLPGTPDAGDGTPAVTGIMAHLVENASALMLGLAGASDDVTSANAGYRDQDRAGAEGFRHTDGPR